MIQSPDTDVESEKRASFLDSFPVDLSALGRLRRQLGLMLGAYKYGRSGGKFYDEICDRTEALTDKEAQSILDDPDRLKALAVELLLTRTAV